MATAALLLWSGLAAAAQNPAAQTPAPAAPAPQTPASQQPAPQITTQTVPSDAAQGGTIKGTVISGTVGKPGGVPLPGVAVTARNTLTGKQYTTTTDIDGNYAMTIPKNGRYVVRVELAGFAGETHEVILNGGAIASAKDADFGMELASRAAAAQAQAQARQASNATAQQRGVQGLNLTGLESADTTDASAGTGNTGAQLPSLSSLNDAVTGDTASSAADSIAVSGQNGQMNGLAGYSEDEIRNRINDAVAAGQANGSIPPGADVNSMIAGVLGGMMGGGGPGGGQGGPGGGRGRGGQGGGGGGGGNFRNFNPSQPHGSIFYQGQNSALNSAPWSPTLLPQPNPSAYQNRYGLTIAASPYIPGLTRPNTKQFVFLNLTGQKNLTQFTAYGRVPTALERQGNFSQSVLGLGQTATPVTIYNPSTGQPFSGIPCGSTAPIANAIPCTQISQEALNLLSYYPAPNTPTNSEGDNYQTVSNGGNNNVAINTRYIRTLGGATATPFGNFGGGRQGRGGNSNAPPSLRQNINIAYNYSHSAQDNRNIFLPLGGATESDGNSLNLGYVVSYGRLSNNASLNWNRLNTEVRNYFTDTANDPSVSVGLCIPNGTPNSVCTTNQPSSFVNPRFYNGLPTISLSNFRTLSNQQPSQIINQTISFSDFVAYRHKKHNFRLGLDVRRVHRDSIGGNNPLGTFTFTGYATADATDQSSGNAGQTGYTGDSFADFLLGLPQSTSIQADLYKTYLRENVYDWYVTDDWRPASNLTLNYGLRYEYFGPYSEKNGRLVNLTGISQGMTTANCITPNGTANCAPGGSASLVNPDHLMYAPRFGAAYRLKNKGLTKDTVLRGGYGVNYNTGQYAIFAQKLSGQAPFATTQTNTLSSGCTTTTTGGPANMTLANGFSCSTNETIQNNWAVDKNYRLGMVQIFNLNIQKTFPLGIVFNVGYNGAKGSNLDVVGSPNAVPSSVSPTGVTTPHVAPFDYEESGAGSHSNSLVVSVQKRQQKGIALGVTYTYLHSIDNASGVGGAVGTPVQNLFNLAAEGGNSSFDQRHNLTGNWVTELPFGPNRAFLNRGGFWAYALDGFSLSGTFTFATGNYLTPQYSGNAAEALSGNVYTQRPNRVFTQPLKGPGTVGEWFNTAAFAAPVVNGATVYGTASQGSIEGPGTVAVTASLSRTLQLGQTRSFEVRATATNVFNTVQYSGISTTENSANFSQVTSAAAMRSLLVQARYRF